MKIENYKKLPEIECIYGLTFDKKKFYIGSTLNLRDRMGRHYYSLKTNLHHSSKLQRAFNKHKNLNIIILDFNVNNENLLDLEIKYIQDYNSVIHGYNMIEDAKNYKKFKQAKTALDNFKKARSKKIIQLDLNGRFIAEFDSVSDAANAIDDQSTNISKCCKRNKTSSSKRKNFIFLYKSDYDLHKNYKYARYKPSGDHLEKLKRKARINKRCKKILSLDNNNVYTSINDFERSNNLYNGYIKYYFKNKTEFTINGNNYKFI